MNDAERDAAVESHLRALDEEIARLRKLGAALDRRIEAAEGGPRPAEQPAGDADEREPGS